MDRPEFFSDEFYAWNVRSDLESATLKLPHDYLKYLPDQGHTTNFFGRKIHNFVKDGDALHLEKNPEFRTTNSAQELARITQVPRKVGSWQKRMAARRMRSDVQPQQEVLDFVVHQAVHLRKKYGYDADGLFPQLKDVGRHGMHHVCRHIAIQNALAYEARELEHRVRVGCIYVPSEKSFFGHATLEVKTSEGIVEVDPTYLGRVAVEEKWTMDELKHIVKNPKRPFYEIIEFSDAPTYREHILRKRTYNLFRL